MANNSSAAQPRSGNGLAALLSTLQQGVVAINALTQTMQTIFPSSS